MAQAALVSHMKLAVQFWYMRNLGPVDCTVQDTQAKSRVSEARSTFSVSLLLSRQTHPRSSGADQVDARRVRQRLAVRDADGAVRELQQEAVTALDDRPSLGNPHVAD